MLFYRVETKDRKGPYSHDGKVGLMQYLEKHKVVDADKLVDPKLELYLQTHPTPYNDPILFGIWSELIRCDESMNYLFGFESLDKVFNWFCLKEEQDFLKEFDYQISVYETNDCYHGKWQSIANKDSSTLVEFIEF